jgi:hypothetical protein
VRRVLANLLIITFLGTYLYAGFNDRELWPYSGFPMYGGARTKIPYEKPTLELSARDKNGDITNLETPLGRSIFFRWFRLSKRNSKQRFAMALALREHNRRVRAERGIDDPIVKIVIHRVTYTIPYPHPETAYETDRKTVFNKRYFRD